MYAVYVSRVRCKAFLSIQQRPNVVYFASMSYALCIPTRFAVPWQSVHMRSNVEYFAGSHAYLLGPHGDKLSLVVRKAVFEVSDQVRHRPGCTVTQDG